MPSRSLACVLLWFTTSGCGRQPDAPEARPAPSPAPVVCPSDLVLRHLHAAVWSLENAPGELDGIGELEATRAALAEEGTPSPWAADLLQRLERAQQEPDPDRARSSIEEVRAELHLSKCIPDALHNELHRGLSERSPATPGGG